MPKVGQPRTFNKKYAFQLSLDGFNWAGFMKCSELKTTTAVIKHREGGTLLPQKSAGLSDFPPITLERGAVTGDIDMYLWMSEVISGPANLGVKEVAYKRNGDLVQLDRDGEILKRYSIFWAFPTEFTAGEWDNSSDENVIEKLVLEYDYYVRTK
jgi:phage tail-like protein